MAGKSSKNRRQLIVLGALLAAIVGVLVFYFSRTGPVQEEAYRSKELSTEIPKAIFERAEYRRLKSPVDLPVQSGPTGRPNPFTPY